MLPTRAVHLSSGASPSGPSTSGTVSRQGLDLASRYSCPSVPPPRRCRAKTLFTNTCLFTSARSTSRSPHQRKAPSAPTQSLPVNPKVKSKMDLKPQNGSNEDWIEREQVVRRNGKAWSLKGNMES